MKEQNRFREIIILIGSVLGVVISVFTVSEKAGGAIGRLAKVSPDIVMEILNILILIFFFFGLSPKKLELNNPFFRGGLARRLNIEDYDSQQLGFNNDRVNKLVSQISSNLIGFIGFLIIFYLINLLKDWGSPTIKDWNTNFPFVDVLETTSNGVSAAFIYLTFSILYNTTLDTNNNESNYYKGTLFFITTFVVCYLFVLYTYPLSQTTVSNIFKLICGIYNGLAMGLLFGRINSMEFYFKDIEDDTNTIRKNLYQFGVTFILPIYVLAQPMFGILEFAEFRSEYGPVFKSIVFLICFIGKGFFLLFIANKMNDMWLHAYLHLLLANQNRSRAVIRAIAEDETSGSGAGSSMLIAGEYEYTCTQFDRQHSHGGVCLIEEIHSVNNVIEWRIRGKRFWSKDGDNEKVVYSVPFEWQSLKAIVLNDKSYYYQYHINTIPASLSGLSTGFIKVSPDGKEITELNGSYYQQSGGSVVWGHEYYKRIVSP